MRLGVIGAGAMGEAVVAAVLRAKLAEPQLISVVGRGQSRPEHLAKIYGVVAACGQVEAAEGSDYVILAVKPQDFEKAASQIGRHLGEGTVLSIMAGVTIQRIGDLLGTDRVCRAMPNTPAQIGEGMTFWTATAGVGPSQREGARSIFAALGKEAFVAEERYLDMATALSGSGPAYVFLFLEALIDAGVYVGLSREQATTAALQTVLGSARYAEQTGRHPADLRNQVSSPGGTTVEALRALEAGGFRSAVQEAVIACYNKSRALGG
jgi:pyrroline-5-carboxylate reductase